MRFESTVFLVLELLQRDLQYSTHLRQSGDSKHSKAAFSTGQAGTALHRFGLYIRPLGCHGARQSCGPQEIPLDLRWLDTHTAEQQQHKGNWDLVHGRLPMAVATAPAELAGRRLEARAGRPHAVAAVGTTHEAPCMPPPPPPHHSLTHSCCCYTEAGLGTVKVLPSSAEDDKCYTLCVGTCRRCGSCTPFMPLFGSVPSSLIP